MNMPLESARWVKSSYSNANGGGCVEWAPDVARATGVAPVRDSKDTSLPPIILSTSAWSTFVNAIRNGHI